MEILSDNFELHLPLIKESILNADFISIDTEFTGKINLFGKLLGYQVGEFDRHH